MRIALTNDRADELEIDRVSLRNREQVDLFIERVRAAAAILWPREETDIHKMLKGGSD